MVLPTGEFNAMIPEPCLTLQGAAIGRIQWHVIPEPRITLQGAAIGRVQSPVEISVMIMPHCRV